MGIAALHAILRSLCAVISRWMETLETKEIRFYGERIYTVWLWLWLWLWLDKSSRETSAHSERPRSGGLVELKFQGLSGMDAARAAMGQG